MSERIIKRGFIGCGEVTKYKSGPAFQKIENSEVVAVMSRNGDKAKTYAKERGIPKWYDDAQELIDDEEVNAVYIATPPSSHATYAIMSMKAGKPVYIEKPMAVTYEECCRINRTSQVTGVPCFVAYYRRYQLAFVGNVAEAAPMDFINVPLDVFRKAAVDQLTAGHPIWFACDCAQFSLRKAGIFDRGTVRVDELFGTEFASDKAHGLEYNDSRSNHAMTLTGVNLDKAGEPDRWKVENSWGKDNGKDGYYVASGAWFDRYVQELIIRKEYLDERTLAAVDSEPVTLRPWQPISKVCR